LALPGTGGPSSCAARLRQRPGAGVLPRRRPGGLGLRRRVRRRPVRAARRPAAPFLRNAALTVKANAQIRAALYFESDPDNGDGTPQQQFRLSDDPTALAALAVVAREPYFNPVRR
jgi:hypothetical protein